MATLHAWAQRHPLALYFGLAYVITWLLLAPLALHGLGLLTTFSFSPLWHVLGALGPVTAAFVVTALTQGKMGIINLLSRMGRWRVGRYWLFLSLFSPVVLLAVSIVIARMVEQTWPDFTKIAAVSGGVGFWLLNAVVISLLYGLGEEPGWRGFALPHLTERRNVLSATLIVGVLWACWHAPMFAYRFPFSGNVVQVIGFVLGVLAGAICLTYLYIGSGGSILMVIIWHAVWNVVNEVALVISPVVTAALSTEVMLLAVLILLFWRSLYVTHPLLSTQPTDQISFKAAAQLN